jgi:hypothetical protein
MKPLNKYKGELYIEIGNTAFLIVPTPGWEWQLESFVNHSFKTIL